ncbi:flavodoxin-dependent (E)-4-hydroxy-3-methylbut-2-enyl-diphosphate synthase [Shigella flexneri]
MKSLRIRSRDQPHHLPTCWRQEIDVIGWLTRLEQRREDIIAPMDVSIIGCVVNGQGEALVSTLASPAATRKAASMKMACAKPSGQRRYDRPAGSTHRAKASQLDEARRIDVSRLKNNNMMGSASLPSRLNPHSSRTLRKR